MSKRKFVTLYETIYNRFKQGAGFLEGDVVRLKKDYKSQECYKELPENIKLRLEDCEKSQLNLRLGRLHTPNSQYGSFGHVALPATHADLYQELNPGNFGNLVTVPLSLLETVDTGVNLAPVSPENKDKQRAYQKPSDKLDDTNKNPLTDEQTDLSKKQTHAKNGDYDLAVKNTKLPNANKWNDSKPSKFKPLPGNKRLKENAEILENLYEQILTEGSDLENSEKKKLT